MRSEVEDAFRGLVEGFASHAALPAGGSAAVAAISMGVGLGRKVCHLSPELTAQCEAYEGLENLLQKIMPEFAADAAAFSELLEAFKRPRSDDSRPGAIRVAWHSATKAPVLVACLAFEAEALLISCKDKAKSSVAGDLVAALELVQAGRRIAEANALENAQHLDPQMARHLLDSLPPEDRHAR